MLLKQYIILLVFLIYSLFTKGQAVKYATSGDLTKWNSPIELTGSIGIESLYINTGYMLGILYKDKFELGYFADYAKAKDNLLEYKFNGIYTNFNINKNWNYLNINIGLKTGYENTYFLVAIPQIELVWLIHKNFRITQGFSHRFGAARLALRLKLVL